MRKQKQFNILSWVCRVIARALPGAIKREVVLELRSRARSSKLPNEKVTVKRLMAVT